MKLDQRTLEIMCLSAITKSGKHLEKALAKNITKDHFCFKDENEKMCYTANLYDLAVKYWSSSDNSLLTGLVLELRMDEISVGAAKKRKFLNLWDEIENTDINDNEVHELFSLLKKNYGLRILNDTFSNSAPLLSEGNLKSTIDLFQSSINEINNELADFVNEKQSFDVSSSADFFKNEYEKRLKQPELYKGIECGISHIDSKTFGWMPGQIVVFLAPSSGGKSVMLLNSALHANKVGKKNVLYMSFEMNAWLCLLRHVSLSFEIPYDQIKGTDLSSDELKLIYEGLKTQENGPYFEYDVNMEDPTPEYIDQKIRDLIASKGKPDLLVVDYIGNMTVRNAGNNAKDWENQSKAVKELFILAKRYNIPILTAQQINREAIRDNRKSKDANKFMSYDQAAASGGQNLMHLCTYAIAMEPNKEHGYCILHPVKMRDAWFNPFPVRMNREFNKISEFDEEEEKNILALHGVATGNTTVKEIPTESRSDGKTPIKRNKNQDDLDDTEEIEIIDFDDETELNIPSYMCYD
jgi:replicative DNA helicase